MSDNMRTKNEANEKANELLFKKMDIITYVRNMFMFDVINQTLINANKKPIVNFLARPIVSINKRNKGEFDEFYRNYKDKDFNKYYDQIQEMAQKPEKEEIEKRLVSMANAHLRSFVQ